MSGAEQHVGGSVPEGDHLVAVCFSGHTLGTGQSEVGQLQLALVVDEQVLRLQVSVQDSARVAERQAA